MLTQIRKILLMSSDSDVHDCDMQIKFTSLGEIS